jgi:hypothetical protein
LYCKVLAAYLGTQVQFASEFVFFVFEINLRGVLHPELADEKVGNFDLK